MAIGFENGEAFIELPDTLEQTTGTMRYGRSGRVTARESGKAFIPTKRLSLFLSCPT